MTYKIKNSKKKENRNIKRYSVKSKRFSSDKEVAKYLEEHPNEEHHITSLSDFTTGNSYFVFTKTKNKKK